MRRHLRRQLRYLRRLGDLDSPAPEDRRTVPRLSRPRRTRAARIGRVTRAVRSPSPTSHQWYDRIEWRRCVRRIAAPVPVAVAGHCRSGRTEADPAARAFVVRRLRPSSALRSSRDMSRASPIPRDERARDVRRRGRGARFGSARAARTRGAAGRGCSGAVRENRGAGSGCRLPLTS